MFSVKFFALTLTFYFALPLAFSRLNALQRAVREASVFALPNDVLATMQVRAPAQRDQHIHVPMVYDSQCSVFS